MSTVVKGLKRAMAGEYSRELLQKVFAGQSRLIELGYRQGGAPGFCLKRMLIDEVGNAKGILARDEHMSIQTDRVTLIPGPDEDIAVVNQILQSFVHNGRSEAEIAADLKARRIKTDLDRSWTPTVVRQVLTNEKYIGNNSWNRNSFKLKKRHVRNDSGNWVRAFGAFAAIVSKDLFEAAGAIVSARSQRMSDEEMLEGLKETLEKHRFLSGFVMNETAGLPSRGAYRSRFGSLLRTYSLVGYKPDRDHSYIEINKRPRGLHADIIRDAISGVEAVAGRSDCDARTGVLTVNGGSGAPIVIAR